MAKLPGLGHVPVNLAVKSIFKHENRYFQVALGGSKYRLASVKPIWGSSGDPITYLGPNGIYGKTPRTWSMTRQLSCLKHLVIKIAIFKCLWGGLNIV